MTRAYGFTAYGSSETEQWLDLPDPTPGPSEILVRVKAAGVNPVDVKIRQGYMDPDAGAAFPQVFGTEAAGVVEAIGQDVDGFARGDEVFGRAAKGFGTYTELTVLDGATTVSKPVALDFASAAAVIVSAGTAYRALEQLGLGEGDSLLVNGAGGSVGVVALQLARDRGIAAFGVASESKRAMVESLGAVLVPYDAAAGVVATMRELLPGGVDGIVDLIGDPSLTEIAVLVKNPAHILSAVGPAAVPLGGAMVSQDRPASMYAAVAELMAAGKIDPKITERYPFDGAPLALRSVESGHALGKIVIDFGQDTAV